MQNVKRNYFKRSLIGGLTVFIVTFSLTQYLAYQQYHIEKESKQIQLRSEVESIKDRLKTSLSHALSATKTLAFIVEEYGVPENFDSVAIDLLETSKFIDALELTRLGKITHVYPLKGNEAAIGYDILLDTTRSKEAIQAIQKRDLFFAGPFPLKQGGLAVVGRYPIYKNNFFWGFSVVLIKLETLIQAAGIDTANSNYHYQISKINPSTGKEEFFLPEVSVQSDAAISSVEIPDGEWIIYVASKKTIPIQFPVVALSLLGLLFSVLSGISIAYFIRQPEILQRMVEEKTEQLTKIQTIHRSTLERVSDAFVALDKNWVYTYMNKKAGEIFNRDPEKMVGKHIWTEFPEGIGQPFYHAYYQAMNTQQYIYLEEYYEPYDLWFENHIYPSADGLSIYFRDITEKIKSNQKIEASEKRFRALIENSSDAIVLIDATGFILYQSPSAERIAGYTLKEIQQYDITMLFDKNTVYEEKEFLKRIVSSHGASLKRTQQIKTKEGEFLWVEGTYTNLLRDPNVKAIVYNYHDITQRRNAERKLEISEQSYRSLFDHNPDAVFSFDFTGKFTSVNESVCKLVEYSREELLEVTFERFIAPEDKSRILQLFQGAIRGEIQNYSCDIITKSGKRLTINVTKLPIIVDQQQIGVYGIAKNITEQLAAQRSLQNSEEKYKFLFMNSPLPKWIYDLETLKILEVNEAAINHYGYTREEFTKLTIKDIRPQEDLEKLSEILEQGSNRRTANFGQWRHVKKNGEIITVEISGHKMEFNGRDAMIILSNDITEKVNAEIELKNTHERLLKLTNKVPAVIYEFEMTPDGVMTFQFVSKGIEQLWPHMNAEKMRREPVTTFKTVHPDDHDRFVKSIYESRDKLQEWNIEYRTLEQDGKIKWIQGSSRPELKADGNVVWYGYLQDISHLKKNEETLIQLNQELTKQTAELLASNEELERFAYVASHDLQEPLRMVSSFMQLLQRKYENRLDDQAQSYISYAVDGSERMKQLILDLLAYSRIGTQQHAFESIHLANKLNEVIQLFSREIQATHAAINYDNLPSIRGVESQITQLFQNLISNALKYRNPDVNPVITISCEEQEKHWYFEVSDNGMGIDARFYNKIFIIFQRLHNRSHYSGTGIGLAICKKIVERHGGTIGVRSEVNKGTTFFFTLAKQ